jgi:hypothetical protein
MCITMGWSSTITKHDYIWHCAFFFVIFFSHANNHTHTQKILFELYERTKHIFSRPSIQP